MMTKREEEKYIYVSILKRVWFQLAFIVTYAAVVTWIIEHNNPDFILPFIALTTAGTSLAMLTAFRFRIAYDRWLEARTLWEQLMSQVRSLTRLYSAFVQRTEQKTGNAVDAKQFNAVLAFLGAYPYSLHYWLTSQKNLNVVGFLADKDLDHLTRLVPNEEGIDFRHSGHVPLYVLRLLSERLNLLGQNKVLDEVQLLTLQCQLTPFETVLGTCERIKSSPLPKRYRYLFNGLIFSFSLGLPWCLASAIGQWAALFTLINHMLFVTLEDLGQRTEIPFGTRRLDIATKYYAERTMRFLDSYRRDVVTSGVGA